MRPDVGLVERLWPLKLMRYDYPTPKTPDSSVHKAVKNNILKRGNEKRLVVLDK